MAMLAITASGQWWSTANGWLVPFPSDSPYGRNGRMSVSIDGALTNGTIIVLRRRLRSVFNGGAPGTGIPVLVIDAAVISSCGRTGFADDFDGVNSMYEYDIGCPTTFGSGDTVFVELL